MAMKRADVVSGMVLLALSVLLLYQSTRLQMVYGANIPGTGFLPFWLSLIMIVLSAVLIVNGLRQPDSGRPINWPRGRGLRWVATIIGALILYTVLVGILGYILSTFLFLAVLIRMLSSYRLHTVSAFSLVVAVGIYSIFSLWLRLSLPTGWLVIP